MRQFVYLLRPARAGMPGDGPTPAQSEVVRAHFDHLRDLVARRVVLTFGRTQNNDERAVGIVIFEAEDEAAAQGVMASDPAVRAGVMTAELFPYKVALWSARGPGADRRRDPTQPDPRLPRIANGRTDLVADVLADREAGHPGDADVERMLRWAAYYGDVGVLRALLGHGAALDRLGADLGINAAAFHGHWQLTEFLIESGADPNWADPATGETPLHSAITNEDRSRYDLVVEVLLAAGADPNARTTPGAETGSFMRACRTRGEAPLHRAAAFGGPATLRLLLAAGADPTQVDGHGDTPLAWASWYRRPVEILRPLLFGGHRIHPDSAPLRENLLGRPSGPRTG